MTSTMKLARLLVAADDQHKADPADPAKLARYEALAEAFAIVAGMTPAEMARNAAYARRCLRDGPSAAARHTPAAVPARPAAASTPAPTPVPAPPARPVPGPAPTRKAG